MKRLLLKTVVVFVSIQKSANVINARLNEPSQHSHDLQSSFDAFVKALKVKVKSYIEYADYRGYELQHQVANWVRLSILCRVSV